MNGSEFPSDDELLFDDEDLEEVAPPGWEGTVRGMKKHKEIDNPFALAWSMKKRGAKSHKHEGVTMKIKWSSLRRLIREEIRRSGLLTEVACPVCGTEGAYVGLNNVECTNKKCRHYVPSEAAPEASAKSIKFHPDCDPYVVNHLMPYFEAGEITPCPGADYYVTGYGALGAYNSEGTCVGQWQCDTEIPDCEASVQRSPDYSGQWGPP